MGKQMSARQREILLDWAWFWSKGKPGEFGVDVRKSKRAEAIYWDVASAIEFEEWKHWIKLTTVCASAVLSEAGEAW
jgi:tRNA(Leu) C34 or U34 (ribose-2'-O)-methylase TrmL